MNLKTKSPPSTGALLLVPVVLCLNAAACQIPDAPGQATPDPSEPWNWSEEYVRSGVNRVRAGRNLNPESWPGAAQVAVLLSFDVDNETVQGLRTGGFSIGPLSQGEYGARVALPRVVRLLDRENIPATFFFPAWSLKLAPEQADVINASDLHEIGVHGWIHELNTVLDGPTEERLLVQALDAIEEITGERPVGYRAPSWNHSPNTLRIIRELGASCTRARSWPPTVPMSSCRTARRPGLWSFRSSGFWTMRRSSTHAVTAI